MHEDVDELPENLVRRSQNELISSDQSSAETPLVHVGKCRLIY